LRSAKLRRKKRIFAVQQKSMAKALWKISLKEIAVHAPVGIHEEEQLNRNELFIDVDVWFDLKVGKDEIDKTVDYKLIYDLIIAEAAVPAKLLETMAKRMVKKILKKVKPVKKIRIRLAKQNSKYLHNTREAVVEIEKERK
jgi:7,8-dihydroneopterin aldolase/epimerase/oxygenase